MAVRLARLPPQPPLERLRALFDELGKPGAAALWIAAKRRKLNVTRAQVNDFVSKQDLKQITAPVPRAAGKTISEDNNRWMMDLLDTSTIKYSGCKFILLCINVFDRVMFAKALKSKSEAEVAQKLNDILTEADKKPQIITSDRGSEFVSARMSELCQAHNIVQKFKDPLDLNSMGLLDRNGGLLKKKLMELHNANNNTWATNLPAALKALNSTPRPGVLHGAAPSDVLNEPEVEFMLLQDQARALAENHRQTRKKTQALNDAGGVFRAPVKLDKFKKRIFHATYGDPQQVASVRAGRAVSTTGSEYPLKQLKVVPVTAKRVATTRAEPKKLGRVK